MPRIGGDFYDVFGPTPADPGTVVVLGDVCGTGPEAAVLTGQVRQTLRALRLVETRPANMLRVLNQALLQAGRRHRFVTMVVGSVTRAEHGRVRLELATASPRPAAGPTGSEQWGAQRLRDALATCAGMPGEVTVERIRRLVSDWLPGGAHDDIAMLAVRAPTRTALSLQDGGARDASPWAIDARRPRHRA